jgi:hypothetical protein
MLDGRQRQGEALGLSSSGTFMTRNETGRQLPCIGVRLPKVPDAQLRRLFPIEQDAG